MYSEKSTYNTLRHVGRGDDVPFIREVSGCPRSTLADLPITTLEYDKVRALLVYLMVESDQAHRRESLVGLLWPDSGERAARQSLSQALSVLRSAIGDRELISPACI